MIGESHSGLAGPVRSNSLFSGLLNKWCVEEGFSFAFRSKESEDLRLGDYPPVFACGGKN